MIERSTLIEMVSQARDSIDRGQPDEELLATLEAELPLGSDVRNLCHSDYKAETIVDLCLRYPETQTRLDQRELADLVRRMYAGVKTEAESILLYQTFAHNCRHPAGADLLLDPAAYFPGQPTPTPEEIAELALATP